MAVADTSKEVPKKGVRQALSMAAGTLSSRILGLLRDILLAALFSRAVTDAWTAAFRLPNLFRRLLGEGSLSVSFIPVFVEAKMDSQERARNLANGLYTLLLIFLTILTVLGIIFAAPLMRLLLSERFDPGTFELSVRLARIMFGFVFFVSTYAYFMGILNALGKFALPAVAPVLFNVAMIVSTLIPPAWLPMEGDALAWGVLIGGGLQMAVLVPTLRRLGALPCLQWQGLTTDMRRVLRNMGPGLVGMGLLQFTTIVNLKYASSLGEGAISYIYWADRLLELPLSLVSVSLGAALLPMLSGLWSEGRREQMFATANYYLRLNFFVAVPAALGLYFLALPIVEVLFLRGEFRGVDAEATAAVLRIYAGLLISTSGVRVLAPAYYAVKNTWFPAVAASAALISHIVLAPVFMRQAGLEGLVVSSLLSATLNIALLLGFYPRFIGAFDYFKLLQQVFKFIVAGVVMVVVIQIEGPLRGVFGESFAAKALILAVTIAAGVLTYGGMSRFLGLEEMKALKDLRK